MLYSFLQIFKIFKVSKVSKATSSSGDSHTDTDNEPRNFRQFVASLQDIFNKSIKKDKDALIIRKCINIALKVYDNEDKNLKFPIRYKSLRVEITRLVREQFKFEDDYDGYIRAPKLEGGKRIKSFQTFILDFYDIPRYIYQAIELDDIRLCSVPTEDKLKPSNYQKIFHAALWLEEAHSNLIMRGYDQENVTISQEKDFLCVEVPGLTEGKPSLKAGDKVRIKNNEQNAKYEGNICAVGEKDVRFKLNAKVRFHEDIDGRKFDVRFLANRISSRRNHHGVSQFYKINSISNALFPDRNKFEMRKPLFDVQQEDLKFHRAINEFQKKAIVNMLRSVCRPMPYILFGPPGTGKTATLVETIHQVYTKNPLFKILICGNSNSSVYVITEKLITAGIIPIDKMIRVIAQSRVKIENSCSQQIKLITKTVGDVDNWKNYQIFLMTCNLSCELNKLGKELFDFIIIDESGHAQEPEALIPLALLKKGGASIIAGDPLQLGPIVMSQNSKELGLGESLLERLFDRLVDKKDPKFDERYITKLGICYRSDQRVLDFNNKLFYNNELTFKNKTPQKLLSLMGTGYPCIFCEVKGREMKDLSSPSWFNREELLTCIAFIYRLYQRGYKPENVGFITPYSQQLHKMYCLFSKTRLAVCKLGTVEEFQGLERDVIIISTVRTEKKNLDIDKKYLLGFLTEKKRFNVATSRAKFLNIVVGDPDILKLDPIWNEWIETCKENDSYFEKVSL